MQPGMQSKYIVLALAELNGKFAKDIVIENPKKHNPKLSLPSKHGERKTITHCEINQDDDMGMEWSCT